MHGAGGHLLATHLGDLCLFSGQPLWVFGGQSVSGTGVTSFISVMLCPSSFANATC